MLKLTKYLISDIKGDWSKPSIKFFRSHGAYGYIIWLTLMRLYYEKKTISVEALIVEVNDFSSRRTIIDFINKGVNAKYVIKKNSPNDKRKILIEPTEITIKEFSEWSKEFVKSVV